MKNHAMRTSGNIPAGEKISRLTVICRVANNKWNMARYHCVCECGNPATVLGRDLLSEHTKSCGHCGLSGKAKHGHRPAEKESPEYKAHRNMLTRCYNPKHKSYKNYEGRRIRVCDRWRLGENGKSGFECFLSDMGSKPSLRHTLDRIDNDGIYEPVNCRWATRLEQQNNKRTNHFITMAGRTMSIAAWARKIDFPYKELLALVDYGEKLLARNNLKG
jgi:hypothetical protein